MKTPISTPSLWTGGRHRLANVAVQRLLLISALCGMAGPASAAHRIWTGAVNGYWSEPNNWSPAGAPINGDMLAFIRDNDEHRTMTNDVQNLSLAKGLFFGYSPLSPDQNDHWYYLHGNSIRITGAGNDYPWGVYSVPDGDSLVSIHCPLVFQDGGVINVRPSHTLFGSITVLSLRGPITIEQGVLQLTASGSSDLGDDEAGLDCWGGISGPGRVYVKTEDLGEVYFVGPANNTFTGGLYLDTAPGSRVVFDKTAGYVVSNLLEVYNSTGRVENRRPDQLGPATVLRIVDNAHFELSGSTLNVGSLVMSNRLSTVAPVLDTGDSMVELLGSIATGVSANGQAPILRGRLNLTAGDHVFEVSGSLYEGLNIEAEILGSGGFVKTGNAALLLTASNRFSGQVTVQGGVLDVRDDHALGDIAGITAIGGGALTLRNVAVGDEQLFALGRGTLGELPGSVLTSIGVSSWAGPVALGTNLVVTGDMTFTGPISGEGGLGCFGGGTVRLGGALANTYTGTTLARCYLLEFNKPYEVKAYAGPLVVGGGAGSSCEARWLNYYQNRGGTLTLFENGLVNLNNVTEQFDLVTFNGGRVETGVSGNMNIGDPFTTNGSRVIVNGANTSAVVNGVLQPYGGPAVFQVADGVADPDLLINASIVGLSPYLIKMGLGTMRLTGANNYIGVTRVNEGILVAGQDLALGSPAFGTIVAANATLRIEGIDNMTESIELNGHGALGGTLGALDVTVGGTLTGPVVLGSASTIHTVAGLAINSVISGMGPLTKTGPGNLFLGGVTGGAGHNTYSADTIVRAGTLYLSKNQNVLSVPGPLVVGPASAASPATARFSRSGTMPPAGTVTVNANSLLDLNGNNQLLSQLNLNDGGDVQTGTGTLSFTGGGSVNVGTLNAPPAGLRSSASISGRIAAPSQDYLVFNVGPYGLNPLVPDPELVVSAQISGVESSIAKNGLGTVRLSGNNTFAGSPSIVTEFNINAGTVIAASPTALGGADNEVYVINGASLALVENITINNKPLYLNSTSPAALDNRGGDNTWTGPIRLSRDTGISVNLDWSLTLPGVVSGSGGLQKNGAGMLRLTGNNTYAGPTTISAGALRVDGSQPQSPVQIRGAHLQGLGTVGDIALNGSASSIAPGSSPGILTCGNFNAGALGSGTLAVELNGGLPGSQYDQVNVRGICTLTGISLQPSINFTPAASTQFTIINNDGVDAVTGTFTGLPQGAVLDTGDARYAISYTGGTGNDVVLTILSVLPKVSITTLPATEVPNYALDFDGSDDRVEVGVLNLFPAIINNFTIELWANPTGYRAPTAEANTGISEINQRFAVFPDHGDLSYGTLGPGHAGAGLSIGFNGISVYEHAENHLPSLLVYPNAISGWTHVALVYTNKAPWLYVNGVLVRTNAASAKPFVHPGANLGGSIQGIGYGNYAGQLDELRIWNRVLSQTQIQSNMNRNLPGTETGIGSGLVAYYGGNENSGAIIADSAPASPNNPGILTNGAAFVLSGALPPDFIYGPTVTLNGLANSVGIGDATWFEWGMTTNYGNVTAAQTVGIGSRNFSFFQTLTALVAGSYHFRAVGSNSFSVSFGLDQSFTLLHGTPLLRIETLLGGQVRLLWPTNGPLFRLQSNARLDPTAWFPVLPSDTVVGTNFVVTDLATGPAQFYRLVNP